MKVPGGCILSIRIRGRLIGGGCNVSPTSSVSSSSCVFSDLSSPSAAAVNHLLNNFCGNSVTLVATFFTDELKDCNKKVPFVFNTFLCYLSQYKSFLFFKFVISLTKKSHVFFAEPTLSNCTDRIIAKSPKIAQDL